MKVTFLSLAFLTALGASFNFQASAGKISLTHNVAYDEETRIVTLTLPHGERSFPVEEKKPLYDDANLKNIRRIVQKYPNKANGFIFRREFKTAYVFQVETISQGEIEENGFTSYRKVRSYKRADNTIYERIYERLLGTYSTKIAGSKI